MILYESIMNFYVMKLIWTILNEFCIQIKYSKIVTIRSIISEIGSLRAMQPIGSACDVCGLERSAVCMYHSRLLF